MIYLFGESLSPIGAPIGAIASSWSGRGNLGEVDGVLQKICCDDWDADAKHHPFCNDQWV